MIKQKKKRKGERIGPCAQCDHPVKFTKGTWAGCTGQRRGWHWTNTDGTHHLCGDFRQLGIETLDRQWRAAMERDKPWSAAQHEMAL